ncbi:MAG TPA: phosphate butyryltransferase [Desulfitobacterium dehalogenans]|uniref:Phosphate butyryltransferase n=1 Tax=Desulfitobacterium dehalogenans TaxID=36854 RepID=A0A7C6Z7E4_9FIRM|nr:phosphate butyryltransferase [Desulfitobacterium dehalogenans]
MFEQILKESKKSPQKIAVAAAQDKAVLEAVFSAKEKGIAQPILVGAEGQIRQIAEEMGVDLADTPLVHEPNAMKAALYASNLVREGQADLLMKGILQTAEILKAVLDKEKGLREATTLSHIAIIEAAGFDRLLFITDAGMNIAPDLKQKADIIRNAVTVAKALGVQRPKVAAISALEIVNPNMPSTLDAAILTQMNRRGQIKDCVVDGPFALDNALSLERAEHKGIQGSEVAGRADIILVPNIETGNAIYKSATCMASFRSAGMVVGAKVPIILPSRADNPEAKFLSILCASRVAAYLAERKGQG